ncbi:WD40 repeat-like protein, partial [Armillaria novae-zelandiae]
AYVHRGPVLCACWTTDGKQLFSGGMDGMGFLSDASTGQVVQSTRHDTAIQMANWLEFSNGSSTLLTTEWDKTMKAGFWDPRTPEPIRTTILHDYPTSVDVRSPLLVIGMAKHYIEIFHLDYAGSPFKTRLSPLKSTTTVVSCFTNGPFIGYAVGAMDGRTAIWYAKEHNISNDFIFHCHSQDMCSDSGGLPVVHAVNDISFHPVNGTLATCGSDGTIKLWDKDRRKRLKTLEIYEGPVSCCSFNPDGTILAYATNRRLSVGISPKYQIKLHMGEQISIS